MKKEIIYSILDKMKIGDIDLERVNVDKANYEKMKNYIQDNNIKYALKWNKHYHYKFFNITKSPDIVYYIWDISILDKNILGIVGPRKNTKYSEEVLKRFFDVAKNYDLVTISGLAPWVDTFCHEKSIESNIPTIAILWGGLNYYLDSYRRDLISRIVKNGGLVISDFSIKFKPTFYSFPQRNRIIAGLCDSLFLPEASEKSGSLITANYALHNKKPVWIAPNNIFEETSRWTNRLLQDKNTNVLLDFNEMLDSKFKLKNNKKRIEDIIDLSKEEKQIFSKIADTWECDINLLCNEIWKTTQEIMQYITMLEINNLIYQKEDWNYVCC